jgi:hypothetical protein
MTTGTVTDLVDTIGLWFVKNRASLSGNHVCVVIDALQAPLPFETCEKHTSVGMNRFYEWNYCKY